MKFEPNSPQDRHLQAEASEGDRIQDILQSRRHSVCDVRQEQQTGSDQGASGEVALCAGESRLLLLSAHLRGRTGGHGLRHPVASGQRSH